MRSFAERFMALLRRRGFEKQQQAAHFLGINQSAVSKYKSGKATPDFGLLVKIADRLDCTIEELTGESSATLRGQAALYGWPQVPRDPLLNLRHRWSRANRARRRKIELAIHRAFEDDAETMIRWLVET
jgi:transcriptional regulator with XRE-family HTH domain